MERCGFDSAQLAVSLPSVIIDQTQIFIMIFYLYCD